MLKRIILTLGGILIMTTATESNADTPDPENTLYMRLSTGSTVTIEMKPDLAPKHVERIKELTREGFYDGIVFHRVLEDFMAQTGDPTGTGMGGSDKPDLEAEFSDYNYTRGTAGMARVKNPNSANSQFFFCFDDCRSLNGKYTVWGQVLDGMSEIDKLAKGEPPINPDKIEKMILATDIKTIKTETKADLSEKISEETSEKIKDTTIKE